ncbi:tyrosine-protein kinase SRK2 [Myxocyprinus asiaticus]|uniref:tyrosine-protein kinase SRK2 n=1 Tax=Myxocyprinus asiaticus TaxID=70543 RepID=UPI002221691A|nr:tyrosine-protein kinase SRK2 [Myxocyprinus asiaticus]
MGDLRERFIMCWQNTFSCFSEPETDRPPATKKGDIVVIQNAHTEPPARVLPPIPGEKPDYVYIALYDYTARTENDLSFHAGDKLEPLNKGEDWWYVRGITGISANKQGYVPANYVAPVESLDAEPWYFPETKRLDAEKMLLSDENQNGAFLIRNCESQTGELSLSVLDNSKVKHYKIKKLDNGGYFVSKTRNFPTLRELVEHYTKYEDGLCICLGEPCKKTIAPETYGLSYNTVDQWEIPRTSVKLLKKLGAGQFGEVFEGIWNDTTAVAVKTLKPGTMDAKDFLREAQIMKRLRHPKLIQLYAVCTLEEPIYIITELMSNGSLLEYLQKDRGARLHLSDQVELGSQVAAGMAYLELQNYIHRDLAARNVLVGENNVCKVADFGLARVFQMDTDNTGENVYEAKEGTKLPVKWTAPEAIHENKFTIKSDVWSFGILLYEIVTFGQMPYPTLTNYQVVQKLHTGYRMSCPLNCPKHLYEIMCDCWREVPADRPTFETLQWKLEDFFEPDVSSYDDASRY